MKVLMIFFGAFLLVGCSREKETIEYTIPDIHLRFEAPLFSGPNTAQANWGEHLKTVLDSSEVKFEDIRHVKLLSAEIYTDSLPLTNVTSLVLQFTSENAPMIEAAVLNPVSSSSSVQLTPAADADLHQIFQQENFTILLDADMPEDSELPLDVHGKFKFLIELK